LTPVIITGKGVTTGGGVTSSGLESNFSDLDTGGGVVTTGVGGLVGTWSVVTTGVVTAGGVVVTGGKVTGGVATGVVGLVVGTLPGIVPVVSVTGVVVNFVLESKSSDLDVVGTTGDVGVGVTGVGVTTGAGVTKVARHFIAFVTSKMSGFWVLGPHSPLQPPNVIP
jgi:hypothetical protein